MIALYSSFGIQLAGNIDPLCMCLGLENVSGGSNCSSVDTSSVVAQWEDCSVILLLRFRAKEEKPKLKKRQPRPRNQQPKQMKESRSQS